MRRGVFGRLSPRAALAAALFLLPAAVPAREGDFVEVVAKAEWKPVFQGVEAARVRAEAPRPLRAALLRVNLKAPGVSLVTTPDNGEKPGETDSLKTSSFLALEKCQAAVNAAPFDKVYSREGLPQDIIGLQMREGKIVSEADGNRPALYFLKNGKAAVGRPPFPLADIREAVAGFEIILKDGKNVARDTALHPRTGAGVSADGFTLYLMAVDGRQRGHSEGCTTLELADALRAAGATNAINLDGGGTTTMVLAAPDGSESPEFLNRPIHGGVPGRERPSGSHLGVRALPLPKAARGGN